MRHLVKLYVQSVQLGDQAHRLRARITLVGVLPRARQLPQRGNIEEIPASNRNIYVDTNVVV